MSCPHDLRIVFINSSISDFALKPYIMTLNFFNCLSKLFKLEMKNVIMDNSAFPKDYKKQKNRDNERITPLHPTQLLTYFLIPVFHPPNIFMSRAILNLKPVIYLCFHDCHGVLSVPMLIFWTPTC